METKFFNGIDEREIKCARSTELSIQSGISFDQDTVNKQNILRFHFLSSENGRILQHTKHMYLDQANVEELFEKLKSLEFKSKIDFEKIEIAKQYAIKCHASTNHLYDGKPYEVHLESVYHIAFNQIHLVSEDLQTDVLCAAWCHDIIEDCRETYNDVLKVIGPKAADIVYAVTNLKGKSRSERAGVQYYQGILNTPGADYLKVCDRIANFKYSIDAKSKMAKVYADEHEYFNININRGKYHPLFQTLNDLCEHQKNTNK